MLLLVLGLCLAGRPAAAEAQASDVEQRLARLERLAERWQVRDDVEALQGAPAANASDPSRYLLARPRTTWASLAPLQVAVRLDSPVTAVHIADSPQGYGEPRHFLLGDARGTLHVFGMGGDIMLQHATPHASEITALAELRTSRNSSYVVTGHADGCVHWARLVARSLRQATLAAALANSTTVSTYVASPMLTHAFCPPCEARREPHKAIKLLHVGRLVQKQRKVVAVAVTRANELLMLRDGHRRPAQLSVGADVLHVHHEHKQVRMMTDAGFAHTTLYARNATVRAAPCAGLNGTRLLAAHPDFSSRSRVYAVSTEGDFIGLVLRGDKRVSGCRTRFRVTGAHVDDAAAKLTVAADAVVLAQAGRLAVFNASGAVTRASRHTLDATLPGLAREIGVQEAAESAQAPLLHASKDHYIVVRLVGNVVAVYRRPGAAARLGEGVDVLRWARPLMLLCMLGFGVWKFVATRSQMGGGGGGGRGAAGLRARYAQALLQSQGGGGRSVGRGLADAQARAFRSRMAAGGTHSIDSIPE